MADTILSRRRFVRTFAITGIAAGACGALQKLFLIEAQAQSSGGTGTFHADLSVAPFTTLQNANGSIRLRVTGTPTSFPQIIITRLAGNIFHAVTSQCTHQGFAVNTYSAAQGAMVCSSGHGGRYSPSGSVISPPPPAALTSYATTFKDSPAPGKLEIKIPNLGYTTAGALVPTAGGKQFRLVFPTVSTWKYEVRFFSAIGGAGTVVPFATTQGTTPSLTVLTGDGTTKTVFVGATVAVGFFSIVTKT